MYSKVGMMMCCDSKDVNRLFQKRKLLADIESGKGKLYKGCFWKESSQAWWLTLLSQSSGG